MEESQQLSAVVGRGKLYHLDDSVRVWSDFLHPHIHPRSVHIIDAYQHNRLVPLQSSRFLISYLDAV